MIAMLRCFERVARTGWQGTLRFTLMAVVVPSALAMACLPVVLLAQVILAKAV